jgi:hypothetical protein
MMPKTAVADLQEIHNYVVKKGAVAMQQPVNNCDAVISMR